MVTESELGAIRSRIEKRAAGGTNSTSTFEALGKAIRDNRSVLAGAGIGGGIGLLAHMLRPHDEDEDRTKELVMSVLTGAGLGGVAGYGVKRLGNENPVSGPERVAPAKWDRRLNATKAHSAPTDAMPGKNIVYTTSSLLDSPGAQRKSFARAMRHSGYEYAIQARNGAWYGVKADDSGHFMVGNRPIYRGMDRVDEAVLDYTPWNW